MKKNIQWTFIERISAEKFERQERMTGECAWKRFKSSSNPCAYGDLDRVKVFSSGETDGKEFYQELVTAGCPESIILTGYGSLLCMGGRNWTGKWRDDKYFWHAQCWRNIFVTGDDLKKL